MVERTASKHVHRKKGGASKGPTPPVIEAAPAAKRNTMKPVATKSNLRDQQRVETSLDVVAILSEQVTVNCKATNVSRAGMMISCDEKTLNRLVPNQTSPAPGQWIEISTQFSLPVVASQNVTVSADCHIVYLRRVSRDEFHVGIQFCRFEGNGHQYVDQYVSRQLSTLS